MVTTVMQANHHDRPSVCHDEVVSMAMSPVTRAVKYYDIYCYRDIVS